MTRRQRGRSRSSGRNRQPSSAQRKSRRSNLLSHDRRLGATIFKSLNTRSLSARDRVIQALGDVRAGRVSNLTQALANRETTLKSARKYIGAHLKQSRPGGPIEVTSRDNLRVAVQIPSSEPGKFDVLVTRNSRERYLAGEWFAAIQEAGRGDFDRLRKFPKGVIIDGRLLPTGPYQVQKILDAMAQSDKAIEAFYVSTRGTR